MALVTRGNHASIDNIQGQKAPYISALTAGEDLDPLAPCYVKASDGLVYMSNGTAANEAARCHGFTPKAYGQGEAVTLYGPGTRAGYGTDLSIGPLYVGATKGRLDASATTGGTAPVAFAINEREIVVCAYIANAVAAAG